jgi:hypothetical protein
MSYIPTGRGNSQYCGRCTLLAADQVSLQEVNPECTAGSSASPDLSQIVPPFAVI